MTEIGLSVIQRDIENRIFNIRGQQVMLDRDLAEIYEVETKRLNEQVRRNINRFPKSFRFQLTQNELVELVANCDRFKNIKHSSVIPFVFTEQGVAMLSSVLHNEIAINVSIKIIETFVQMRKNILSNAGIIQRLDKIEHKQLESDKKFDQIFDALESSEQKHDKGIFFEGQVFDAYIFVAEQIKKAKKSVIIIEN